MDIKTTIGLLGVGLFAGAGSGLFFWKRGGDAAKTPDEPVITLPVKQYRRILVPTGVGMCHEDYVSEAAELACHLATTKGNKATEIVFTYVIPVPRALPLNAHLPAEEAEAERVLNAASALAKKRGIGKIVTQLRKGRTVVDETTKAAAQEEADLVILTPQSHAAAQVPLPFDNKPAESNTVPGTQAACRMEEPGEAACLRRDTVSHSRCYAELDTAETSDQSETVTGRLLRRLPCEAMVTRRANMTATALPGTFS